MSGTTRRAGFIGLGRMGEPMARNLLRAGVALTVWNRSSAAAERLGAAGASVEHSAGAVLRSNSVTFLMLANEAAMDQALGRGTAEFQGNVARTLVVQLGTTSPEFSRRLEADIKRHGGRYVEAPVSGSRKPAEDGALVGMLAGDTDAVETVRELCPAMCREVFACGPVPNALLTKLSVNVFLITMVTGLIEASHFASRHRLDPALFRAVLDAGPMASSVSRLKLEKLTDGDYSAQASIDDVLMNSNLIMDAARSGGAASPLMERCRSLFSEAATLGVGALDMVAVVRALDARADGASAPPASHLSQPAPNEDHP